MSEAHAEEKSQDILLQSCVMSTSVMSCHTVIYATPSFYVMSKSVMPCHHTMIYSMSSFYAMSTSVISCCHTETYVISTQV